MPRKLIDLTGQTFGLLTVLERDISVPDKRHSYWKCQCSCEAKTIKTFMGDNLRGGRVNSCGCLRHQSSPVYKNAVGETYNNLTAIKRVSPIGETPVKYLWQCECGNTAIIAASDVRSGHTRSCGCIKSCGEYVISKILRENQIKFIQQYSFLDCLSPKGNKLKFDFAIINDNEEVEYVIEYQGEQHYKPMRYSQEDINFPLRQERDQIKRDYCLAHNIPLIEIPYTIPLKELTIDFLRVDVE